MDSKSQEELSCPVCFDIFKAPVLLSCSHSVCKDCLQQFWKTRNTQECPVCRRRSSKEEPPYNLALKNLCELFLRDRRERSSEEVCSTHSEKLKLFCLTDKEPVCLVCRDSQKHTNHTFQPINEVVPSYKEELKTALKSLREKLKYREEIKGEYYKTVQHMKTQAEHTELQIKHEFKKLHQFLSDEEQATITALRKEVEKKNQMMKEKLEEMNRHISALSNTIKNIEERMKANDVSFLKSFNVTKGRARITQPDPEMCCGALIDVPLYLGNLAFRVWKKMQDIVQNTPVVLDPNTASPQLILSDDLTSLTYNKGRQPLPDNPERFDFYRCVLGSEGFKSGAHCWDVEVGNNSAWTVGIIAASYRRKGDDFFKEGVWYVQYTGKEYISQSPEQHAARFPVREKLRRIRVQLDWDNGNVSFSDPVTNTQLCAFKTIFKETLFPFFQSICEMSPLRIVPVKVKISSF
ncbi:E3 ubiquitin-protein ligase TRIM35 [Labeo rohita]|uniref:E3 ubiquitin-protein ligase TRIM35 n=1 Tax=Labeo rohita TaxID=84645 RepID=A0ABQ8LK79_LABRO|nr:E3 ubiquitin-protein ligase TRIM35 [Labeo rohita]KAI2650068.1 E3 ubiquitin-protein ligase TRIM35 [Labeo rohita]